MDNISAIALCMNPVYHERSKHIDVKYHLIREYIEEEKMSVEHVRTELQLADILTKGLVVSSLSRCDRGSAWRRSRQQDEGGELLAC